MTVEVAEGAYTAARVVPLLDALRAAELTGAGALGAWLEHCADPALRGGLRVVRARDLAHAELVARRLEALGARPGSEPSRSLATLRRTLGTPGPSDRAKLGMLVSRFPAEGHDPLAAMVLEAGDDDETRALLEVVADDDRASIAWFRAVAASPGAAPGRAGGAPRAGTQRRLDALRAAETASARVFSAWAAATPRPAFRAGLRVVAAREAVHGALLEARLRELGGRPEAMVPDDLIAGASYFYGDADVTDDRKLERLLVRYPDAQTAAEPALALAAAMADDPETREMLKLVGAAERATIVWLRGGVASAAAGRLAPTGS